MQKPIRPIRIEGQLAYVTLTKGYEAVIDAVDVPLVEGRNWYASVNKRGVYAYGVAPRVNGKQGYVSMHRIVAGAASDVWVDHRDCDGLNNRRGNLRVADPTGNARNRKLSARNKIGLKGVYLRKDRQTWRAVITINYKRIMLGTFKTPEEAHAAYCEAARKHYGEFARTE